MRKEPVLTPAIQNGEYRLSNGFTCQSVRRLLHGTQDPEDTASSGGEGRQTPGARLKPGGPCCICGATYSSTWYGKKNGKKFCRGNPCKKVGGYSVGKRKKRCGAGDDDDDVGDFSENIYKISGVEACLGFRRAATALACLARRSSY